MTGVRMWLVWGKGHAEHALVRDAQAAVAYPPEDGPAEATVADGGWFREVQATSAQIREATATCEAVRGLMEAPGWYMALPRQPVRRNPHGDHEAEGCDEPVCEACGACALALFGPDGPAPMTEIRLRGRMSTILVCPACARAASAGTKPKRPKACDCTHEAAHHDPATGACFYTNPSLGPCPCAATPEPTRAALTAAHRCLRATLKEQGR